MIFGIDAWERPRNPLLTLLTRKAEPGDLHQRDHHGAIPVLGPHSAVAHSHLPCSIDLDRFRPGPVDPALVGRYGLAGKRVLFTFGRLVSRERAKGMDEVMEAMPGLLADVPDLVYLIGGDGPDRPRLAAKAESLGLGARVIFAGRIAEEEKVAHYRLADAYVMPSRGEGFGIVLLEAMACGVPALASAKDGGREALLDGKLGLLVDPDDARKRRRRHPRRARPAEGPPGRGWSISRPRRFVPVSLRSWMKRRDEQRTPFASPIWRPIRSSTRHRFCA